MSMEIEHKLTEEQLQALYKGKKLVLDYQGRPRVTLYPPRYGFFMTWEKYAEIERAAFSKAYEHLEQLLMSAKKD